MAALTNALPETPMILVVEPGRVDHWDSVLGGETSDLVVIGGGERRQDSVRLGVEMAAKRGAELVMVHDAARPLVHPDDIRKLINVMGDATAAILVAEVCDTVKRVDEEGIIRETVDRGPLRLAQTPQVFRVSALEAAWRRQGLSVEWSDEAALLEADGCEVRSVVADHPNPKLTTAGDFEMARLRVGGGS